MAVLQWDIESAIAAERELFAVNGYRGAAHNGATCILLDGERPVLVSAPHAVKHLRRGVAEPKEEDEYTGTLARLLHALTGCHAIYLAACDDDPNFYNDCAYKEKLRQAVLRHGIGLVLDLHGSAHWRLYDIDIGTCHGASLLGRPELVQALQDTCRRYGINEVFVNHTFSGCGQPTVTRLVSTELGIPALQLEINKRWRDPVNRPEQFRALVDSLAEYILAQG
ncbi:MAG: N-formylglutamate amidohydrolase [Bacillota bacterium]